MATTIRRRKTRNNIRHQDATRKNKKKQNAWTNDHMNKQTRKDPLGNSYMNT